MVCVRSKAIQEATKGAALVPFKVGETANELFALADVVITRGNTNAVTDGAVAASEHWGRPAAFLKASRLFLGSALRTEFFVDDLNGRKHAASRKKSMGRNRPLLGKANSVHKELAYGCGSSCKGKRFSVPFIVLTGNPGYNEKKQCKKR